jgi:hypothetical protein
MEGIDGKHVGADDFVCRLGANVPVDIKMYATQFGAPLSSARIDLELDPSGLQRQITEVGVPVGGVVFDDHVTTDAAGTATVVVRGGSIDKPRGFVDGQVYGIRPSLADAADPDSGGYSNHSDFISALVWSDYHAPAEPALKQDVEPILSQYARLYPVMKPIVDLADYDSVVGNIDILQEVFDLPQESPHYMPVTRDLSPAKRQMILAWLRTTGNAGQPNLDRSPGAAAAAVAEPQPSAVAVEGGKTAALALIRSRQQH